MEGTGELGVKPNPRQFEPWFIITIHGPSPHYHTQVGDE